jgi:hypothetical protein
MRLMCDCWTGKPSAARRRASSDWLRAAPPARRTRAFLDAERALDEREATAQFVLGKMPGQRDDLAALGPWRNRHDMRKKRSSLVSDQSSRRIASRVLPPLRMM